MDIRFIAGSLSLDFLNTVHTYGAADPRDELNEFKDLIVWSRKGKILGASESRRILREARRKPSEAERFLKEMKQLRTSLYGVFGSVSKKQAIDKAHLPSIRRHLSRSMAQVTVRREQGGYRLVPGTGASPVNRLLFMILESTLRLLMSEEELSRVRQCQGNHCTWLFLDRSKNRSRKWCEMQSCGSRAKSRRYYEKKKRA